MVNEEKKIWGIHTQDDNLFLKGNVIAIGWHEMGNLSLIDANRDAFKDKYVQAYPDAKKGSIATAAGMLYRSVMRSRSATMSSSLPRAIVRLILVRWKVIMCMIRPRWSMSRPGK